jgi:hypothetical protein
MKTFIVIQMQIDSIVSDQISMSNIVRKVEAETMEQAIGKFVVQTAGIKAKQKLNIECYEIDDLKGLY